jgi:hypothetical protein
VYTSRDFKLVEVLIVKYIDTDIEVGGGGKMQG